MNLPYNSPNSRRPLKYSDIFLKAEKQYSEWNFNVANTEIVFRHFDDAEKMCQEILGMGGLKKKSSSKKKYSCPTSIRPVYKSFTPI